MKLDEEINGEIPSFPKNSPKPEKLNFPLGKRRN
jgi:hypothetical protein